MSSQALPRSGVLPEYQLSDRDQIKMLRKLLLYWDGQWFLKTFEAVGLEAAIDLNARVRAAFGRIEMRMLLKMLGRSHAQDLRDAVGMLKTYAGLFFGNTLRSEFVLLDNSTGQVTVHRCAAYEGAKRAGLDRSDQACVACETLWSAWLATLLPEEHVTVELPQRMGKGDPTCQIVIRV